MSVRRFPEGVYGRQRLRFFPAPFRAPLRSFAALAFAWCGDKVLLCDIEGRGWCVPSGKVEPYESSMEAVKREALEEAGAVLADVQYIGCYHIRERREVRWADCFTACVADLVEIGMKEESHGRALVSREELPQKYHLWTPLTEAVFAYSREVLQRHQRICGSEGETRLEIGD